jgi:patatin-like phospholipase/acyl hydrolase
MQKILIGMTREVKRNPRFFFNENDDASERYNKDNVKENENDIETRIFPKPTFEMPHNLSLISLYTIPFMLSFLVFDFNFISQVSKTLMFSNIIQN